jgi:hypothetical protein
MSSSTISVNDYPKKHNSPRLRSHNNNYYQKMKHDDNPHSSEKDSSVKFKASEYTTGGSTGHEFDSNEDIDELTENSTDISESISTSVSDEVNNSSTCANIGTDIDRDDVISDKDTRNGDSFVDIEDGMKTELITEHYQEKEVEKENESDKTECKDGKKHRSSNPIKRFFVYIFKKN